MGRKRLYSDEERKERKSKSNKKWREKNPNYDKQYHLDNREKRLERSKQWQKENPEKHSKTDKKYRENNPKMGRTLGLICAYRQSDKKTNRGECTITAKWMVDNVFSGQKCFYCGESEWTKLGLDRIDNSLPHTPDNVVVCCEKCNKKRGSKSFEEFCKEMGVIKIDEVLID